MVSREVVSLRKANYLEKKIAEGATELSVTSSVDALIYSDYEKELTKVHEDLVNYIAVREKIAAARQTLRRLIKQANTQEVDGLLDSLSGENRILKVYSNQKGHLGDIPKEEVVKALLARAEKVDEDSWRSPSVKLSSLDSHEFLDDKIKQSKKRIMHLEERLTEVNLSTKIHLPEEVVSVLDEMDLI